MDYSEINILIIDEPELNLHPQKQLKLIELFELLVSSQVKLFITTHSDYVVRKMYNEILKNEDIQNQDRSMYLMKGGNARKVDLNDGNQVYLNFKKASDDLDDEYYNLIK